MVWAFLPLSKDLCYDAIASIIAKVSCTGWGPLGYDAVGWSIPIWGIIQEDIHHYCLVLDCDISHAFMWSIHELLEPHGFGWTLHGKHQCLSIKQSGSCGSWWCDIVTFYDFLATEMSKILPTVRILESEEQRPVRYQQIPCHISRNLGDTLRSFGTDYRTGVP